MRPFPVATLSRVITESQRVEDIYHFIISNMAENVANCPAIIAPCFTLATDATLQTLATFAGDRVSVYRVQNRSFVWISQALIIQDVANNELNKRGYTTMRNAVSAVKGKVQGLLSALKNSPDFTDIDFDGPAINPGVKYDTIPDMFLDLQD